jgi:hypothetical protein
MPSNDSLLDQTFSHYRIVFATARLPVSLKNQPRSVPNGALRRTWAGSERRKRSAFGGSPQPQGRLQPWNL